MPIALLRRVFCVNLEASDYKEAVFDHESVWRDLTLGIASHCTPPVPAWIDGPSVDDHDIYEADYESTTFSGLEDELGETLFSPDRDVWDVYKPKEEDSVTTEDDSESSGVYDADDDGSSYVPSHWHMDDYSDASFDSFEEEDYVLILKPWTSIARIIR